MRIAILLAASLWLAGCGEPMGGGGSDQPNKIEVGRILTSDGRGAARVRVISWNGTWDPIYSKESTPKLDSGYTDSLGYWRLKTPSNDQWYVTGATAKQIALALPGHTDARLGDIAPIAGTLAVKDGIVVDSVWMGGAGASFLSQAKTDFTLNTSPGPRRVWARVSWNGGYDTLLLADKFLQTPTNERLDLVADTGRVLLVSAESSPIGSALRGQDFPVHNSNLATWSSTPSASPFPLRDSSIKLDATGRYFFWMMSSDRNTTNRLTSVSVKLSSRPLDWTGVQSLEVVVRGGSTGILAMQVRTRSTDSAGRNEHFETTIIPPTTPDDTTVTIDLQSLRLPSGSSSKLSWNDVRREVTGISFTSRSLDATLQLRWIWSHGNRLANW